jgi:hypothetical protein
MLPLCANGESQVCIVDILCECVGHHWLFVLKRCCDFRGPMRLDFAIVLALEQHFLNKAFLELFRFRIRKLAGQI